MYLLSVDAKIERSNGKYLIILNLFKYLCSFHQPNPIGIGSLLGPLHQNAL